MNIVTVIPLSKTKVAEELIYFTSSEIIVGAVVTVPLRKKDIYAIVTKVENVKNLKSELKNAPFEIKKLNSLRTTMFFPVNFLHACKELANFYAHKTGSVIDTLVSNLIMENIDQIAPPLPPQPFLLESVDPNFKSRTFAVQGDDADRMSSWRSLIRQEFANKRSLAIYAPTIEDCQRIFSSIEKGIEGYIFLLNSELNSKKFIAVWKGISETDHPIVVVATASFSILPRGDIQTIIIERENSRGWISPKIPYLDQRHAIVTLARANKQNVYLADTMLRLETQKMVEDETIEEGSPFKWRSVSLAKDLLVEMRNINVERKPVALPDTKDVTDMETKKEVKFKIISEELKKLIKTNTEENDHLFIFATRKGLAPLTICDDCGTIVTCQKCQATIVLHKSEETGRNFFMCHNCGDRRSADEYCSNCKGWRLTPLGLGIDRIIDEIKKEFPDANLLKLDSDSAKNDKDTREIIERFRSKPGSVLIGTEMFMHNFGEKIDNVAIASLDSLFSLPDFRIEEKIMYTLVRLRTQATKNFLVQTRKSEQKVFEYGLKGNLSDFYRNALKERKKFNYPPFTILIKISIEGKKDEIAKEMGEVTKTLDPHEMDIFPAFTSAGRGKSIIHGLIKVASHAWPENDLINKLRSLPPNVMVKVNPETLL